MNEWIGGLLCALIGAMHGPATCYVVGGGWIDILLFALIGAIVIVYGIGLFVSLCPQPQTVPAAVIFAPPFLSSVR